MFRSSYVRRVFAQTNARVNGAVAQLGERGVRNAEARGSIPLCSTNTSATSATSTTSTTFAKTLTTKRPTESVHQTEAHHETPTLCNRERKCPYFS
jgi:hypothetical protein